MTSQHPPEQSDAVEAAQTLATALDGLSERLDDATKASEKRDAALTRYGHRNRALIAIDVLLTIAIAVLTWQLISTADRAESAAARAAANSASDSALHKAQLSGCAAGNVERKGELALWTYLFHATKPTSAEQEHAIAVFMDLVGKTFATRDCSAIYRLPPYKPQKGTT